MSTPKPPADLPHESTDPTSEPRTLGRYQLLAKIASGGMASVFLARSGGASGFEKLVALKRIHPHLAEEQSFVDMFLDEARIASRIQHANVCAVFDFGEADGTFFIAMEYLVGEPFARVLKAAAKSRKHFEDPRHPYLVSRAIADAAEGLHAAHELRGRDGELLNVVHRDISPQNLFLTYEGNVKVVDFGIASAADRVHHTQGGEVKGKFSYMAPEQAKGAKGGALDRRADVFALGIVLWEMLTLKRLFRRDTPAETLYALIGEDIPLPSTQRPNVPPEIDPIVMKALARNPAERYSSTRELGRDLLRFVGRSGEPVGMADLAEWMERLLPEERAAARRTVDAAQSGDAASVMLMPTQPGDLSGSDVVAESSKVHMRPETYATRPSLPNPKATATPSGAQARKPGTPVGTPAPRAPAGAAAAAGAASLPPEQRVTARPATRPARQAPSLPPPAASPAAPTVSVDVDVDTVEAPMPAVYDPSEFDAAPTNFRPSMEFAAPPAGPIPQRKILTTQISAGTSPRKPLGLYVGIGLGVLLLVGGAGLAVKMARGPAASSVVAPTAPLQPLPPIADLPPTAPVHAEGQGVTPPIVATNDTPHVGGTDHPPHGADAPPHLTGTDVPPPAGQHEGQTDGTDPTAGSKIHHAGHHPPPVHVAPATGTGFVQVVTPGGWANVFDAHGRPLGQTPGRFELPSGHQTLTIRPFGQPPNQHADVTINAGATVRLTVPVSGG